MTQIRVMLARVGIAAAVALVPAVASAQTGIIAGVVKDASGAVMPGVTVEAASPALIERVRTAVTDGAGQYKIVDLTPGTYTVTFGLAGFSTVKRDGIELSAGFTASVNADLRVGALEETLTVTGASPVVDVQNTRQQTVMGRDIIDAIPAAKSPQSFAVLVPGVIAATATAPSAQDVGGTVSDRLGALIVHGSRSQEMPTLYDGMRVNNMNATPGGSHLMWSQNAGAVQEYTIEVGALSAEADVSGVRQNAIPKTGGNVFHSSVFADFTGDRFHLQSTSNVPDPSKVTSNTTIWDINPTFGGPIRSDKLWIFAAYRYWGTTEHPPGAYYDTHAVPNAFTPDLSKPAYNEVWSQSEDLRLTWQANAEAQILVSRRRHGTLLVPLEPGVEPGSRCVDGHALVSQPCRASDLERAHHEQAADRRRLHGAPRIVVELAGARLAPGHVREGRVVDRRPIRCVWQLRAAPQPSDERQVQRHLRDRFELHQGRLPGDARQPHHRQLDAGPEPDAQFPEWRACVPGGVRLPVRDERQDECLRRGVCVGPVDPVASDAQPRSQARYPERRHSRTDVSGDAVCRCALVRRREQRAELEGHQPAVRLRLRLVRKRQDGAEVQRRPLRAGRDDGVRRQRQSDRDVGQQHDAHVDWTGTGT